MSPLTVREFSGGVVTLGAADTRAVNELLAADSLDIGARGSLVASSDVTDYTELQDNDGNPFFKSLALIDGSSLNSSMLVAVGEGYHTSMYPDTYLASLFARSGASSPIVASLVFELLNGSFVGIPVTAVSQGVIATAALVTGTYQIALAAPGSLPAVPPQSCNILLINLGAREQFGPNTAPGLFVLYYNIPDESFFLLPIKCFDALGTGPDGEVPVSGGVGGASSQQLFFRGIVGWNGYVFGWGFSFLNEYPTGTSPTPVITLSGTGNKRQWGYQVVTRFVGGSSALPSPITFSTDGPDTLNGSNYNILTFNAPAGNDGFDVYRVFIGGVSPLTLGLIYTDYTSAYPAGTQIVVFDQGAAGDGTFPQTAPVGTGDGPARVMFCNLGNATKWGNDNINPPTQTVPETDRQFTDSDAIEFGGSGEHIRAGCVCYGILFFGTNTGLHYVAGNDRDTFVTDGAIPINGAYNTIGPGALIQGPDRKLYGVCDQGLWRVDQAIAPTYVAVPLYQKLRAYDGRSTGYWDLIWTDPTASESDYPGQTNQDLVWMAVDYELNQVLIGIPFCDGTTGAGAGTDTVVIRYQVMLDGSVGGFTRQVFFGVTYTAAAYLRRYGSQPETKMVVDGATAEVGRYAYGTPAPMPAVLPAVTFGPYAPFGPDGVGVVRRLYLTLSWVVGATLPLVFDLTLQVDEATVDAPTLTIGPTAPGSPAQGDLWLDTSQTNTSLGNATSSSTVPATGGYLLNTYNDTQWDQVPGLGMQGTRATIPIPVTRRNGTRYTLSVDTTVAASRFELEGISVDPGSGKPDA